MYDTLVHGCKLIARRIVGEKVKNGNGGCERFKGFMTLKASGTSLHGERNFRYTSPSKAGAVGNRRIPPPHFFE